MLFLDEPTNHLDAESVRWLEQFLQVWTVLPSVPALQRSGVGVAVIGRGAVWRISELQRHCRCDHARQVLPGQRGWLDSGN